MNNSKISLAELKESNINQLIASDMLMVRGGCGRRRQSRSNKCGGGSRSRSNKRRTGGGCSGGTVVTPTPTPVPIPVA